MISPLLQERKLESKEVGLFETVTNKPHQKREILLLRDFLANA
jgi:hypothetical protein